MGEYEHGARSKHGDHDDDHPTRTPVPGYSPEPAEGPAAPAPDLAQCPVVVPPGGDLDDPFLGGVLADPQLQALAASGPAESRRVAVEYQRLAGFWREESIPEDASPGDVHGVDEYEAETLAVALALRCTRGLAYRRINDAHLAVTSFPACFARLAAGEFPVEWFQRLLRRSHHLTSADHAALDDRVATWPLGELTVEQYRRRLSHALARIEADREVPAQHAPEARRRVDLLPAGEDGIGCLQVTGPIPEILTLAQRLDASARAVQDAQRHALETGEPPPLDPGGTAATHGKPLSLARIRYELLTNAGLDTDGVRVPGDRFRLTVTVPALTLLGASQEPGTLDGTIPVPAPMARELAGDCDTWYRVLTDPASGAFLPLPAQSYRPPARMLEYLRLRHATCAVPGCTRPSSWASECDHIQEYNHADPASGGLTEVENLHLLCFMHHRLKTLGLIDPTRQNPAPERSKPGVTRWEITAQASIAVRDDTDLATPATIADLTAAWDTYQHNQEQRALRAERARTTTNDQQRPPPPSSNPHDEPPPF